MKKKLSKAKKKVDNKWAIYALDMRAEQLEERVQVLEDRMDRWCFGHKGGAA